MVRWYVGTCTYGTVVVPYLIGEDDICILYIYMMPKYKYSTLSTLPEPLDVPPSVRSIVRWRREVLIPGDI